MAKYKQYTVERETPPMRREIHPVWRGIGFALMVIFPVISYFGAVAILQENAKRNWVQIQPEFLARGADPLLYVKIFLTVVLVLVLYILFMVVTFLADRLFGPPRYGPLDSPEIPYKGRKRY
jgi:hypothetical protein